MSYFLVKTPLNVTITRFSRITPQVVDYYDACLPIDPSIHLEDAVMWVEKTIDDLADLPNLLPEDVVRVDGSVVDALDAYYGNTVVTDRFTRVVTAATTTKLGYARLKYDLAPRKVLQRELDKQIEENRSSLVSSSSLNLRYATLADYTQHASRFEYNPWPKVPAQSNISLARYAAVPYGDVAVAVKQPHRDGDYLYLISPDRRANAEAKRKFAKIVNKIETTIASVAEAESDYSVLPSYLSEVINDKLTDRFGISFPLLLSFVDSLGPISLEEIINRCCSELSLIFSRYSTQFKVPFLALSCLFTLGDIWELAQRQIEMSKQLGVCYVGSKSPQFTPPCYLAANIITWLEDGNPDLFDSCKSQYAKRFKALLRSKVVTDGRTKSEIMTQICDTYSDAVKPSLLIDYSIHGSHTDSGPFLDYLTFKQFTNQMITSFINSRYRLVGSEIRAVNLIPTLLSLPVNQKLTMAQLLKAMDTEDSPFCESIGDMHSYLETLHGIPGKK